MPLYFDSERALQSHSDGSCLTSGSQDFKDMPVRCAVCTKCANGVDTIWGMDRKPLYSKEHSSRDIKNCTKASLRDSFPCRHNGTIILPTNDSFVFYRVERNEEGLFPIEECSPATDCPVLDLPSTVTPDPLRPGDNTFRTTPSPQGTHGILIGCLAGVILLLILIGIFLICKKIRARRNHCLYRAGIAEVAHSADSNCQL